MRSKQRNRNNSSSPTSPIKLGIDPFDPRYANVPLDVPLSHVEDYVKRKNSRNDQDHLQTQIMYFKKEFGNLPNIKTIPTNNNNNTISTQTQTQTQTANNDHKDENNDDSSLLNIENDDIIFPSYDSISSIRSALARYEAWQYNNNHNNNNNNDNDDANNEDFLNIIPMHTDDNNENNTNTNGQYQYVAPFYNPFLRITVNENKKDDDDDRDNNTGNEMTPIFPLSHYQHNNRNRNNHNNNHKTLNRNDLYQRYRQYHRYRHTFRALQYHNIRRRLWNQTNNNNNSNNPNNNNYFIVPQLTFNNTDNSDNNNNKILTDDDNDKNIKLKVVSPKIKHPTCPSSHSRLDGLQDFKAAFTLIPLRLTSLDPFNQKKKQRVSDKQEIDDNDYDSSYDENDYDMDTTKKDKIVIFGIDKRQNLLSQLSSDLHLIILNMLTGLCNVRTMALYNSLSSDLSLFDIERIRNCSVYKCQALFVERYRQNLFDEKYKALQQPALTRALSTEPRNLFEFQQDRKAKVARKSSFHSSTK